MSEVIEEDMDEEDVKEEFRWWRPRISQKLMVKVKNGLLFYSPYICLRNDTIIECFDHRKFVLIVLLSVIKTFDNCVILRQIYGLLVYH